MSLEERIAEIIVEQLGASREDGPRVAAGFPLARALNLQLQWISLADVSRARGV